MVKPHVLVQVLFALWLGVLATQMAIDDSGKHLGAALTIGAIGTISYTAAYAVMGFYDARKKARQHDNS